MSNPTKNLVVVGDGAVGKTCMLNVFINKGGFDSDFYEPTIFDMEQAELELDNEHHLLKLYDTAGQEDYERIRQVFYKEAHCFILCFSLSSRSSLENILAKWYPELKDVRIPIVLVGTKSDMRHIPNAIQAHEVEQVRRALNANAYLECSAKEYENIDPVIHEAVRAVKNGIPVREEVESEGCCSWNPFAACCSNM